jgi:hypothetical protein
MKKIYILSLIFLTFTLTAIAKAQPPELTQNGLSPEDSVNTFLYDCSSGAIIPAAFMVQGADQKNPALASFGTEISESFGKFVLGARNFKITIDPQNSRKVKADFILEFHDEIGHGLAQADSASLQQKEESGFTYWQIIPGDPKVYEEQYYLGDKNMPPQTCGLTTRLATEIAYPGQIQFQYHLGKSISQLKQLGLALMQFAQDYHKRLNFDQQNFREKLMPYLKEDTVFTAPGDPAGTVSYQMNPSIAGLNFTDIKDPQTLVAFYLGEDQTLDFKFSGYSVVSFMDGHVKAVTPEEAKQLRWKP